MKHVDRFEASLTDEGRYRLLLEAVTDYAIYMLDSAGVVTSWNPGAQRFKGYQASEIIGRHFSRFYTAEDQRAGLPARALETSAREGKFESEGWRVRKDGSRFWAHVVIDPIREPSGKLIGFAKITRDITDQRDAQLALEAAREALFQSQKMDALGQLTGGIAHDFNNLLTVILGSLELVHKYLPDDPKINSLIGNAVRGAQRGATLTQRMLAFARRQELKPEQVDVPALMRGMSDLLQQSLGPTIAIETRFPPVLPPVEADANQLELALLNLVVNARDAMPDGGPLIIAGREESVTPSHVTALKPGRYLCLSVTDTGEGMDEPTLARAVEPFFTTKGPAKGTGLGLPMVHGVAEQSGGRLILKSRNGEGTTAELWLPVATADFEAAKRDRQAAQHPVEETRRLVVVAVDDDDLVLTNTTAILEDLGHTVFEATSGKQALEILRREKAVDLVITDHAMPQMTGAQLAEAISAEWRNLPIVLATGYAELPPGALDKLPKLAKPFSRDDLVRVIAGAMQMKPATRRVPQFSMR
jgi:PAS domain S-box-containing protein